LVSRLAKACCSAASVAEVVEDEPVELVEPVELPPVALLSPSADSMSLRLSSPVPLPKAEIRLLAWVEAVDDSWAEISALRVLDANCVEGDWTAKGAAVADVVLAAGAALDCEDCPVVELAEAAWVALVKVEPRLEMSCCNACSQAGVAVVLETLDICIIVSWFAHRRRRSGH
jgi:hypothetical protein